MEAKMYYITIDGVKQPTPYLTYVDAMKAWEEIWHRYNGTAFVDIIYE